jgi:hypothetical protein
MMTDKAHSSLGWIEYRGERILRIELHNLEDEEYSKALRQLGDEVVAIGKGQKDKILMIMDIRDNTTSAEVLRTYKEVLKKIEPYVKASAATGVKGLRLHMMNFLKSRSPIDLRAFNAEEQAKEWLLTR